jgi:hypothetical protein
MVSQTSSLRHFKTIMVGPNQDRGPSGERTPSDKHGGPTEHDHDPLGLDAYPEAETQPDDDLVLVPEQTAKPNPENKSSQPGPTDSLGTSAPPEPLSPPKQSSGARPSRSEIAEYFHLPDKRFSRPTFFRAAGRVAGGLGVVVLVLSVLLIPWERTWFTGAVLLILMFLVGEAAAVILEAIGRLERRPPPPPPESGEE